MNSVQFSHRKRRDRLKGLGEGKYRGKLERILDDAALDYNDIAEKVKKLRRIAQICQQRLNPTDYRRYAQEAEVLTLEILQDMLIHQIKLKSLGAEVEPNIDL